jgi:hypothetical protein
VVGNRWRRYDGCRFGERKPELGEQGGFDPNRRAVVEDIVRGPLKYLRANRKKGESCLDCILFLQQVRREIQAEAPSYSIDHPDPIYAQFHRLSNGTVEHYVALFSLLKAAGFSRIEVESAIQDFLPDGQENVPRGATIRSYLSLTAKAVELTYGQSQSRSES